MKLLIAAILLAPLTAHAAIVGVVKGAEGQVELHDTAGICVNGALAATYRPARPADAPVQGCWTVRGPTVYVVFLDGDIGQIPMAAVRKPESV